MIFPKRKVFWTCFALVCTSLMLSVLITYSGYPDLFRIEDGIFNGGELTEATLSGEWGSTSPITGYFGIIFGIQSLILFFILMSKSEFRDYLLRRPGMVSTGAHRLSVQDVLDNENRSKIIDLIIENPGIHYSQLLRETSLAPGNLTWHIEILEIYKIIKSQVVGKYVVFFPYYLKNPLSDIDLKIQKSTTCMEILDKIQSTPGITQAQIAKELNKNHKTVKYHLEKLFDAEIIESKKQGRRKLLFSSIPLDHFNSPGTTGPE